MGLVKTLPEHNHKTAPPPPRTTHKEEPWTSEDYLKRRESRRMTDEINSNPAERERLEESRRQAREGEVIWEDDDTE
jgi:hypothetical protein